MYETTLPQRSEATRWVVDLPWSVVADWPAVRQPRAERSPFAVGVTSARCRGIWQARLSANRWESRVGVGTSTKAGSPTYAARSAKASAEASR